MSPSKVALSLNVAASTKDGEFSRGSAEGTTRIHLREDRIRTGRGRCRFRLRLTWSHVSKYRDPRRNLRNRRMTSFIDHVATINLIWFSARGNMAADDSRPCAQVMHVIIRRFHYFENTLYTCAIVRRTIAANCHLYAVRLSVST